VSKTATELPFHEAACYVCVCVYVCNLHLRNKTKLMALGDVRNGCVVKHEMVSEQN
jgi:hypothetical protein